MLATLLSSTPRPPFPNQRLKTKDWKDTQHRKTCKSSSTRRCCFWHFLPPSNLLDFHPKLFPHSLVRPMIASRWRGEELATAHSDGGKRTFVPQSRFFIDDMSSSREIESKNSEMAENRSTAGVQIVFVIERRRINKFSNFSICYSFSLLFFPRSG